MANTTNTPKPRSAVGVKAMNLAINPALIINPEATQADLFSWAVAELAGLHTWMDILACSKCDFDIEPSELASLVAERLAPVMQGLRAALESGRV